MPGGARVGAGRHADPGALRRERKNDPIAWVHLPAAGRPEPAPDWPLTKPTQRERALWEQEWARPQAIMWERNGLEREVALYVRALRLAESSRAPATVRTLVRQYMDGLGLTLRGMAGLRWVIDPLEAEGPPAPELSDDAGSEKDRFLHVVADAG